MTVAEAHIAHHKHVQALYEELLKDVEGIRMHKQPEDARYDANFWLCTATIDPDVKVVGQENAYKEVVKTAVGGAAGVIKAVDSATTDCQPNENVEAMRVFMLAGNDRSTTCVEADAQAAGVCGCACLYQRGGRGNLQDRTVSSCGPLCK